LDIASLAGLVLGIVLFIFGVATGSYGFAGLKFFWDTPSFIITVLGSLSSVLTSVTLNDFISGLKAFALVFKTDTQDEKQIISSIMDLSNVARKEGLLALEEASNGIEDQFLKKGVGLIVDGTDPGLVRSILETELIYIETRHKKTISFWETFAALGPAWGMIGTLIGLILMLQNLSDTASIGPNMAVALITTLYGSLIANWIATPVANKLSTINAVEISMKEVMIEGLLSIQAGENPRLIEEKLKSFLSPSVRASIGEDGGGE
jgi:chemotaxis protein MotA